MVFEQYELKLLCLVPWAVVKTERDDRLWLAPAALPLGVARVAFWKLRDRQDYIQIDPNSEQHTPCFDVRLQEKALEWEEQPHQLVEL
jgi:hypothetical protein